MKVFTLLTAAFMFSTTCIAYAEDTLDYSGTYTCECSNRYCASSNEFTLTYDKETLRIDLEGKVWSASGHVARVVHKTVGVVFLNLPRINSVYGAPQTIKIDASGKASVDGVSLSVDDKLL